MRKIFLLAILFLLASCERNAEPVFSDYTEEWADPWRAAYAELLREYENAGYTVRFFLHDMTGRGIPEIFIDATHDYRNCFISLYTFGVDDVQQLEFEDAEGFLNFIRDSRTGLFAASANEQGLEGYSQGLARSFRRYEIQTDVLVTTLQGVNTPSVVRPREREILWHILTEENLRAVLSAWQPNEPFFRTMPDLPQQIKSGDFSSLYRFSTLHVDLFFPSVEGKLREMLECKETYDYYEWVEHDITGNGVNDLILRTRDGGKMQKIVAIFTFDYEEHTTKILTFYDTRRYSSSFYFLGENGNRIWHSSYGTNNTWHWWAHNEFLPSGVDSVLKQLTIVQINYPDEVHRSWLSDNPEMSETGVYFTLHRDWAISVQISENEFLELFEEMTGFSFCYVWSDWADRAKDAHRQEARK
jgi:hypothetical protein